MCVSDNQEGHQYRKHKGDHYDLEKAHSAKDDWSEWQKGAYHGDHTYSTYDSGYDDYARDDCEVCKKCNGEHCGILLLFAASALNIHS
eukprot:31843-Eustigmatos_ZCMA.PRE.1